MGADAGQVEILIKAINMCGPGFAAAKGEADAFGGSMTGVGNKIDETAKRSKVSMASMAASAGVVGKAMAKYITVPTVAIAAASAVLAYKFSESMQKIADYTGTSATQLQAYKTQILQLGPAVGQGPDKLSDALYYIISRGYSGAAAMQVLKVSAEAASAGMGDTTTVAQAVTTAMYDYGKGALSASKATNIMVTAVRLGAMAPADFATALGRILPLASELHIPFAQVSADLASLTRAGMATSAATMGMRMVLQALYSPTKAGAAALAEYGFSASGVQKMIAQNGLLATLVQLKKAFGDNLTPIKDLSGGSRGMGTFLALTANGGKNASVALTAMSHAVGATANAFKDWENSPTGKVHIALATLEADGVLIGNHVLPVFDDLLNFGTKTIGVFSEMPRSLQDAAAGFVVVMAAVGPLLMAFSKLYKVVVGTRALMTGVGLLKGAGAVEGAGASSVTGGGAATIVTGGESVAAGAGGAAGVGAVAAVGAAFAAAIIPYIVAARIANQNAIANSHPSENAPIGSVSGTAAGAGHYRVQQIVAHGAQGIQSIIARLDVEGATASAGKIVGIVEEVEALQKIAKDPIICAALGTKQTMDSARTLRDQLIQQFHMTKAQANSIISQLLHIKITDYVTPQMTAAQQKVLNLIQQMRNEAGHPISFAAPNVSSVLNALGSIRSAFGGDMSVAQSDASAISSAIAHAMAGAQGGAGHYALASGGVVTSPQVHLIGESGPEAVIPLSQLSQVMGARSGGGDTYYVSIPVTAVCDSPEDAGQAASEAFIGAMRNRRRTY